MNDSTHIEKEFDLLVDEARDRLKERIAEDVEDVVSQLLEEGICTEHEAEPLKQILDVRWNATRRTFIS